VTVAAVAPDSIPEIKPRRVSFDLAQTSEHWVPGDPTTTHIINVLHLLLPAGERWFVHVYKETLPLLDGRPELKAQVKGFMGQEAVHARVHDAAFDHMKAQQIDASLFVKDVDFLFNRLLGDKPMYIPWSKRQWLLQRVAIIAAIEHFTAVLGYWIIDDSAALDRAGADPQMLDLLRWHGAEEVEHRSVAFDVMTEIGGGWLRRVQSMAVTAVAMYWLWRRGSRYLCKLDPTYNGPLPTLKDYRRAAKVGRLPMLRELVFAVPRFCRRSYHPSQEADTNVALRYLASSPAALAAGYTATA
jgi:hypothetical protein